MLKWAFVGLIVVCGLLLFGDFTFSPMIALALVLAWHELAADEEVLELRREARRRQRE